MRFGVDTGGTFTDLVIENDDGDLELAKAQTTPEDPVEGILDAFAVAAARRGQTVRDLLAAADVLVHGTTHALNAIVTGATAKTALLTTEGHEDVLVFREGGRIDPYDYGAPRPTPYVPRRLSFGIRERVWADGRVLCELDEAHAREVIAQVRDAGVESVAVCLLWSVVNPSHELALRALLAEELPGVPVTLSHELNPTIREYRRASATAIDASLKPLMASYLGSLERRLADNGFGGRLLVVTSGGGVLDASVLSDAPIHSINSGPAMAPVAAKHYAARDTGSDTVIVGDAGGTTFDVSLIRRGRVGRTRETWIGPTYSGHMTGFQSVDITSAGAGGGSIARVDPGGLLHVGPESAGADPGPACFGRGGTRPTVTDANLVLGRLDADYFLGGAMRLDADAARAAIDEHIAGPMGMSVDAAAAAVLDVVAENMTFVIEEITVNQGIDPADAVYVAGGGAAGLNAVTIARRLGCAQVVIPETVATLSAAGALMSELTSDHATVLHTESETFDIDAVNAALGVLETQARGFISAMDATEANARIEWSVEARYTSQLWEIEVPLPFARVSGPDDVRLLRERFEELHRELYGFADPASDLTFTQWHARAVCGVRERPLQRVAAAAADRPPTRTVHFPGVGWIEVANRAIDTMGDGEAVIGPAILESPLTTVVVDEGTTARRTSAGSIVIDVGPPLATSGGAVASRMEGN